jgi:large subunit ribosomal protein L31
MKSDIHPEYQDATINCACGNSIQTKSTRGSFTVDVCSACHPFYTGKQRMMDTAGRVERFRKKYEGKAVAEPRAPKAKPVRKPKPD